MNDGLFYLDRVSRNSVAMLHDSNNAIQQQRGLTRGTRQNNVAGDFIQGVHAICWGTTGLDLDLR